MRTLLVVCLLLVPLVPVGAASDAPGCPEESITIGTHERHTVTVYEDCSAQVIMGEGIICLGGGVARDDTVVGPLHVTRYYCTSPMDPRPAPDAEPRDLYLPALEQCLWKGSWKALIETPVLRVWHYTCDDPHS